MAASIRYPNVNEYYCPQNNIAGGQYFTVMYRYITVHLEYILVKGAVLFRRGQVYNGTLLPPPSPA